MKLNTKVNGEEREFEVEPGDLLMDVLRREGYTEVKNGCSEGDCGACTTLIDGVPQNSCITFAMHAEGREVTTVKGIGTIDNPHPLQVAFTMKGGSQCGFCTPGLIVSAYALLQKKKNPTDAEIKHSLDGNICRCTGYVKILDAVRSVAGGKR